MREWNSPMFDLIKTDSIRDDDNVFVQYAIKVPVEDPRLLFNFLALLSFKLDGYLYLAKNFNIVSKNPLKKSDAYEIYEICKTGGYDLALAWLDDDKISYIFIELAKPYNLTVVSDSMEEDDIDNLITTEALSFFLNFGANCYIETLKSLRNGEDIEDRLGTYYTERFIYSVLSANNPKEVLDLLEYKNELFDVEMLKFFYSALKGPKEELQNLLA